MSFRARLTLSYAIFAAIVLTLVSAGLVVCVTFLTTRSIAGAIDQTANRIEQVVRADRGRSENALIADVRRISATAPNGIVVQVDDPRRRLLPYPFGLQITGGPVLDPGGPVLHLGGPPRVVRVQPPNQVMVGAQPEDPGNVGFTGGAVTVNSGLPPPLPKQWRDDTRIVRVYQGRPILGPHPSPFDIGNLLALGPRLVTITPEIHALVAPDLQQISATLKLVGWSFLIALVLTLVAAWGIGRWITDQAVAPLVTLARELRRFAAGDFTPRHVRAFDRSEVGALVDAYNGAAAQVAAAFDEQARVQQHMRRFLGEAGHEMRTPLTVISGYLDVLERGGWHEPEVRAQALPMMRGETRRLRMLVERLMTLARLEGDDRSEAEIVDVVATAQEAIVEVTAARGGTVRLHADGDHLVFAEPVEVYEAIINLVDNARKYGGGSDVDVTISEENGTVLRVRDGGPGISEADRARLFERFFRGEAANGIEGSGLGLAIVARAAERSHGTVTLESSGEGATTFRLWFPPVRLPERDRSVIVLA